MATPALMAPCQAVQPVAWHLSVGIGIGILGFLGVVVPLVREHMGKKEKAIWTALLAILLILELRSIRLDEIQHDREQAFVACEQQHSFQEITDQANTNFDATAKDLNASITSLGRLLGTTQTIFQQTAPHAELLGAGVIPINLPMMPEMILIPDVKYRYMINYVNSGSKAGLLLRNAARFYVAKPEDLDAQKKVAAQFEEDWRKVPLYQPVFSVLPGGPHFWEEDRTFTAAEIESLKSKGETVYVVARMEYSDPTGKWWADKCDFYQAADSKINPFVTKPCFVLTGDRYRAKQ